MKKVFLNLFNFSILTVSYFCFFPSVSQASNLNTVSYNKQMENLDFHNGIIETKDNAYLRLESSEVDGGWWRRGTLGLNTISNYQHYTREGHASCENSLGHFNQGGWQPPYHWSESQVTRTLWGNKAYYNYR